MRDILVVKVNQLFIKMRLLHQMIGLILVPKTGWFNFITKIELMLIIALVRGTAMNVPDIMFRQMQEAARDYVFPTGVL